MDSLLLFDIDGTLVKFKERHSSYIFIDMFKYIFNEDISFDDLPAFDGATDISILLNMADSIGMSKIDVLDSLDSIWDYLYSRFLEITNQENLALMSNSNVILEKISIESNIEMGLLTGNFKRNAYLKMSTHDLDDYFPYGAFGDDAEFRNDLPKIAFARANSHLNKNFNSKNTIIIGDSIKDIECAKSNDLKVIAVATGNTDFDILMSKNPDICLHDLTNTQEFFSALRTLNCDI